MKPGITSLNPAKRRKQTSRDAKHDERSRANVCSTRAASFSQPIFRARYPRVKIVAVRSSRALFIRRQIERPRFNDRRSLARRELELPRVRGKSIFRL